MRVLNIEKTSEQLVEFIRTTVKDAGFTDVIIAVSGGVDSATAVSLAVKALGPDHVHALLLPYKDWHTEAIKHSRQLFTILNLPDQQVHQVDIAPMVDSFRIKEAGNRSQDKILSSKLLAQSSFAARRGNIMARVRMTILFDFAKAHECLVVGTENKSEHYLGYYTRFGDEASDIEPLRCLYKTEVFALAGYLGVPEIIIHKPPTAGLWAGQTDEGQFGFGYREADKVLWGLYEARLPEAEILAQGISKDVFEKVKRWVASVDFKHHLPYLAPEPIIHSSP